MSEETNIIPKQIKMDAELFEDVYSMFSAMRLCPEIWASLSKERHKQIMEKLEPIWNELNS